MTSDLPVERVTVKSGDYEEEIIRPRLIGTVFHVTTVAGFAGISNSGVIRSNQDGMLGYTFSQSQNSYGRRRGWVCLFDLREAREDRIWDNLDKFPLPNPRAFLFIDPTEYAKLVPPPSAAHGEMIIPYIECWYPGDVPVQALSAVLMVRLVRDHWSDRLHSLRTAMRHGGFLEPQEDLIEAGTLPELRQAVENWVRCAQLGGLEVDKGWDETRVEKGDSSYSIAVHANPVAEERPGPEPCPNCGSELRSHSLSPSFSVGGGSFVPSTLDCIACGYGRPVLEPVEDADAAVLAHLTPEEWNLAYGQLMDVWRRWFQDEEQFLTAYRQVFDDDERMLVAWRQWRADLNKPK